MGLKALIDDVGGDFPADVGRIEALCAFFAREMGLRSNSEVSISFVDLSEIHELNRRYRGIDRPTDVLSFECDGIDDGFPECGSGTLVLGDVMVCGEVAAMQARENGHSFDDETDLLILHGLLHLCGYDHMEEADAAIMEPLQDELLRSWDASGRKGPSEHPACDAGEVSDAQ